jgi:hypothetical protein
MEQRETMKAALGVNPETATRQTSSTSEVKKEARRGNGERRSSGCLLGSDIKVNTLYGKGELGRGHHLSAPAGRHCGCSHEPGSSISRLRHHPRYTSICGRCPCTTVDKIVVDVEKDVCQRYG